MYKVIFYAYDYKVIFKLIVFFAPNCEPSGSHILLLDTVQGGHPSLSTVAPSRVAVGISEHLGQIVLHVVKKLG